MVNPIWEYSLAVYGREEVARECLRAQDELQADVNTVLYAGWLASTDQRLSFAHLEGLDAAVGQWRERVVVPLRTLRRQLRDYPDGAAVRDSIKALELQSEERQQGMMWRYYLLAPALVVARQPLEENLVLAFESMGCERERWSPVVETLVPLLRSL
jgi:uncharacterized protein (TIGR02444 family)